MFKVRGGTRYLQFEGTLLASSSSWRRGSHRWIEFDLYRTESGTYILSRIGRSTLYHMPDCVVVSRNSLRESPRSELGPDSKPCDICHPESQPTFPFICPEKPRYHAQVCDGPEGVLDSLHRYDDAGSRYLTLVAERLLDEASKVDDTIASAYQTETIL